MKTLAILVLLLTLIVVGFGYVEYRQYLEISGLEVEVASLEAQVSTQTLVIASQQKVLSKTQKQERALGKVLLDVVDFLSHLQIETQSESGPRS
jgi:hypothetical protein